MRMRHAVQQRERQGADEGEANDPVHHPTVVEPAQKPPQRRRETLVGTGKQREHEGQDERGGKKPAEGSGKDATFSCDCS